MVSYRKAARQLLLLTGHPWAKSFASLLLFVSSIGAQSLSFLPHKDIPVGTGCCSVAAGDFDRDGKTDLVVSYGGDTTQPSTKLAFLRGDGHGGFQAPIIFATFDQGISNVLAADVNRDGRLDLFVEGGLEVGIVTFQTYILMGNGDGTFGTPFLAGALGTLSVVADFNGDGLPDLLITNGYSLPCYGVEIQLGHGDGTFGPPSPCVQPPEGDLAEIAAVELNGDGKLDVVWTSYRTASIWVWIALGNGDGTLQPFFGFQGTFGGGSGGHPFAVGDFNHDGIMDLVVSGRVSDLAVSLGKGGATFQDPFPLIVYEGPGDPFDAAIFVADLDGDGNPDIIAGNAVQLGRATGPSGTRCFSQLELPIRRWSLSATSTAMENPT